LAQQQLDAEQKKFNEGLSTNFQVLQFQGSLASARSRYTQALTSYNQALAGLEQVTGTTLQNHNIIVNE
jgi:outer membrane protein TolC